MPGRLVEAPDGISVTTTDAAKWLGWPVATFRRVAQAERSWFRPLRIKAPHNEMRWPWLAVVALEYVYRRKPLPPRESKPQKTRKNPDPS